jgi:hypothetical protein
MITKQTYLDPKKPLPLPKYLKSWGGYNEMPDPFKEISWHKYFHFFRREAGHHEEHRQVMISREGKRNFARSIHIEWYSSYGLALESPGDWTLKDNELHYLEEPRYFYLGCNHDWQELSVKEASEHGVHHFGNCYHVNKCKLCGLVNSYDSSD